MQTPKCLRLAVRTALAGAAATALTPAAFAQDQDQDQATTELGKQTVTGSRIRRIDVETSSPVFTIDRNAIEKTGAVTLGSLIQQAPVIAGAATNPAVNNGGGTGVSTVSLRGVGSQRTLVLVNGRRWITDPDFDAVDINAIPINLIERVEILKDGASAIYGSDAIGGVVNFITRSEFDGFEFTALKGESSRDDGGLDSYQMTLGTTFEAGHFMLGAVYDNRDQISSADRPFSEDPFALYNGIHTVVGSSRTDTGFYRVPRDVLVAGGADLSNQQFCPDGAAANNVEEEVVTRIDGRPGTSISDYRCFVAGGPGNDNYDFQDVNVVITPQERYGLFVNGRRDMNESVGAFFEGAYHFTTSMFQIAPEPFDGRPSQADVPLAGDSIYNPFGVDVIDGRLRLVNVGNRVGEFESNRLNMTAGFEGDVFTDWRWSAAYTWGQHRQDSEQFGELYSPALTDAVGPSFRDVDGTPTCGTPAEPVAGCVPVDFFSVPQTPEQAAEAAAGIAALVPKRHGQVRYDLQVAAVNLDGDLFEMPAGPFGVAIGVEYREEHLKDEPDFLAQQELLSGGIEARAEGGFNVGEAYLEVQVPILKDMPLAQSLELDAGIRYSDYSTFGETTNAKYGLEWRPGGGLLLRGTFAEVFRAPTASDLFLGLQESADTFVDPCNNLTAAILASNPNAAAACVNVPTDGSFGQTDSQLNAFNGGNSNLQPEEGDVITYGVAWTPEFLPRLYTSVDYYKISLEDTIGTYGTQVILDKCFLQGLFCDLFTRDTNGEIFALTDTNQNVGSLDTEGVDIALQYSFPDTSVGKFRARLDTTYLISWDNERLQGDPSTIEREAGMFLESSAGGDGHFARWRGLGTLDWTLREFSATARARYIGAVTERAPDFALPPPSFRLREIPDQTIIDLQGTYRSPWGIDLTLGVDNVTDELAPLIYSGFNGTTDVRTYDGIGRFYYLRLAFKG
jgi:iron complex outermembrane receptor protein